MSVISALMSRTPAPFRDVEVDTVHCAIAWHGHVSPVMKRVQFSIGTQRICVIEDGDTYEAHVTRMASPFMDESRFLLSFDELIAFVSHEVRQ